MYGDQCAEFCMWILGLHIACSREDDVNERVMIHVQSWFSAN